MKRKTRSNNKQSMQGSAFLSTVSIISLQLSSAASLYVLAMEHDASDILGHTGLPVSPGRNSGLLSFSMGQWIFIGVVLFVVYIVAKRLWKRALIWQEQSYKLWVCGVYLVDLSLNFFYTSFFRATRRRHGIPDNDLRPFNVAYSAAMTRAREEESRAHVKSNPLLHLQGRSLDRHNIQPEQTLWNRTGAFDSSSVIFHLILNLFSGQTLGAHPETITVPAFKPTSSTYSWVILLQFLQMFT